MADYVVCVGLTGSGPPARSRVFKTVSAGCRKIGPLADVAPEVKIGEAALASGVSARSLRHYEEEGLIVPGRCGNGFRDYCQSTLDRVLVIRSLLESGLPVRLIRESLFHPGTGAAFLHRVQSHRDRLAARIAVLSEQQAALDAYLRQARRTDS